ncbi:MAG: TPR repeat protein [Gammaproteobacteria bacterium]|jgi:TPR repeat protein
MFKGKLTFIDILFERHRVVARFVGLILTLSFSSGFAMECSDTNDCDTLDSMEQRALGGSQKAQMKLAGLYLNGAGVEQNVDKAIKWYRVAADNDVSYAQYKLAWLYLEGRLVDQDVMRAKEWFERASTLGYIDAQLDLSRLYSSGQYFEVDYVAALKWVNIADSLSSTDLQFRIIELEEKMNVLQRFEAMLLFRTCLMREYRDC